MRYYIHFVHHPLGRNIYKQYIITNELPSVNYYSNIYNAFELKCINDEVSYRAVNVLVQNNDSIFRREKINHKSYGDFNSDMCYEIIKKLSIWPERSKNTEQMTIRSQWRWLLFRRYWCIYHFLKQTNLIIFLNLQFCNVKVVMGSNNVT